MTGKYFINWLSLLVFNGLAICCCISSNTAAAPDTVYSNELSRLGKQLFFDVNLSNNRTQACAGCHDPERAFTDGRDNGVAAAVSQGDDGVSLGERNTPTIGYAFFSPEFHRDDKGEYIGGQFYDGRAASLVAQAGEPILNPAEMGLENKAVLSQRIQENPVYVDIFKTLFGDDVFLEPQKLDAAVRESIAAFEKTAFFAPFDSKYDRYLLGEYQMTQQEELGRQLFFSSLINCNSCHMLNSAPGQAQESFSNYHYHNIGVPENVQLNKFKSAEQKQADVGLLANPKVSDPIHAGKFKVPTLRNVAVTSPYMHNGAFRELKTAVFFYNQYLVSNADNRINPETGKAWGRPEVQETISLDLLREGQPLDEARIESLLAFLKTLTDKRYEALLK